MENIIVIDNFLNSEELQNVKNILNNCKWEYGHTSNGNNMTETPFWTVYLNNEKYISEHVKNIIEKFTFKKFDLLRVYCNGQTYGQDGAYHTDSDNDDEYTFCLYINYVKPQDIEMAAGYLFFKLPDLNYKICYEPINNRGLFFPSKYVHRSSAFSRFVKDIRMCIAWKLKLRK